jgi:energy-coupling factor transporter transmembrane protein EcfT
MFQWSFSSRSEKSATWYIFAIMIALVFVVLGFINQMYLMSIVVFIFVGVYILFENNSSPQVEVVVNEE